jgi:hypothetical protein
MMTENTRQKERSMSQTSSNLDYAPASTVNDHLRRARIFRRIALGCALTPMAVGIGIVLLFWITDWGWLPLAGLIMLPIGGLIVLTGSLFVLFWMLQQRTYARKTATPMRWWPAILMLLLLLSNFAVAAGCVKMGIDLSFRPWVVVAVRNDTAAPISRCVIRAGMDSRTGSVTFPGNSMAESFKLRPGAAIHVHIEQAGKFRDLDTIVPANWRASDGSINIHVKPTLDMDVQAEQWPD